MHQGPADLIDAEWDVLARLVRAGDAPATVEIPAALVDRGLVVTENGRWKPSKAGWRRLMADR